MIVCKFGGSSLADGERIRRAADILRADEDRRYVVVSAPGKRNGSDEKVTDLLLACQEAAAKGRDFSAPFAALKRRFLAIAGELCPSLDMEGELESLAAALRRGAGRDYAASRGEYLSGRVMAGLLGWAFVDAAEVIAFHENGAPDEEKTMRLLSARLKDLPRAVIPGFYGARPDGSVCVFSRGGSDVTGSLAAAAAGADLYENWTDVSGLMMADPRIVPDARGIAEVTYRELRELSYMGATVLHEDAVFPVRRRAIPIRICNSARPEDPGTRIVAEAPSVPGAITGIAGKKGFSALFVEKDRMNAEIGFGRRVLSVLEEAGVSFEHLPTGIDTLSVLVESHALAGREERILAAVERAVAPDRIHLETELALVAVVGRGMIRSPGCAARLFSALARAGVNVRMIDQGSSELNVIVGVDEKDYERTVEAIYREFVPFAS
ncbi:MAG: aspartate kinase [Clostridia bacterium]|nr:aspartate kinase [Clostridia bacterium]